MDIMEQHIDLYNLKPHWMADLMPTMPEKEFEQLKEDISGLGQLEPILIFNGEILDGRHRYRACMELGIEPWVKEFDGGMSLTDVIRSLNVYRRHLTTSQRAMIAAELLKPYEELARERQAEAGGDRKSEEYQKSLVANLPQAIPDTNIIDITPCVPEPTFDRRASEQAASGLAVSGRSVRDAKLILENGTEEEKQAVKKGKAAVSTVAKKIRKRKQPKVKPPTPKKMNFTNDSIEWAKWSWNPVTGCLHGCPYCYAMDISVKREGHFKPTYHPDRLEAPKQTRIPAGKENEPGINNVFVCSMADLFGDWVDPEWIQSVIDVCREQSQWTYLFLTKNPERYAEFEFPENCWLGASATNQEQFDRAMRTFESISSYGNVKFLSCEPLNEPIHIEDDQIALVDWVIIGGRTGHNKMPAFQPEWEWVKHILIQADKANIPVYFKPNLTVRPREYPKGKA